MAEARRTQRVLLGIDVGGSGIKGAPIDVVNGQLVAERQRLPTPQPSIPDAIGDTVAEIVKQFEWRGPIGITFPAPIKNGVTLMAANVDQSWVGTDAKALFEKKTGCPVLMMNDADAAGVAEMEFGAGKGQNGTVLVLTVGTGIGSAIFVDGRLIPNTEFGHLQIRGKDAEHRASDRVRQEKDLDWDKWSERLNEFLQQLEILFTPDLLVIGGGVSKKFDKFAPYLETRVPVVPAQFLNDAGMIGVAMAASSLI